MLYRSIVEGGPVTATLQLALSMLLWSYTKTFNMQFTLLVKFGIGRKYVIWQH